ncbi:MAG: YicC family protein [Desulfobacterota bacterium]|nr:YicC family protein [Thermodesulfobacteriota bacterium]MDW8001143.1 YicC/YloC family endoribonuclease [Deltaproteobacteria bacterium]
MVKSMTGFSKIEKDFPEGKIYGEARSLNNRYLELNIKIPKADFSLEQRLREIAKKYLRRGRVDVVLRWEKAIHSCPVPRVNEVAVSRYLELVRELKEKFGIEGSIGLENLFGLKDVIFYEEQPPPNETYLVEAFEELLRALDDERRREGRSIQEDLEKTLKRIGLFIDEIEIRIPHSRAQYEKKLKDKLKEAVGFVNEERLLEELLLYAERCDVAEEISRLRGHMENFISSMQQTEPIGRKLDFIIQEMLREANTIGSKSTDLYISERVVSIKVELEKLREQVQNVE